MSTEQKTLKAELAAGCQQTEEQISYDTLGPNFSNFVHCDFVHYDVGDIEPAAAIISDPIAQHDLHPEPKEKANPQSRFVTGLNSLRSGDKAYFGWSQVSFKLSAKALGKARTDPWILRNQKGTAIPGEVVAIVGASGSGKTSLLNVLGGRIVSMDGHEVNGIFSINGIPVKPENLGAKVAFVTQEDTLCATSTPREALNFSAQLRLPPSVSEAERKQMVDEAIEILRLDRCVDSMIGDEMTQGISGGEKR
jgi:ABC-type transport system involved in cytochrome c biogenesis ATPase subunit